MNYTSYRSDLERSSVSDTVDVCVELLMLRLGAIEFNNLRMVKMIFKMCLVSDPNNCDSADGGAGSASAQGCYKVHS